MLQAFHFQGAHSLWNVFNFNKSQFLARWPPSSSSLAGVGTRISGPARMQLVKPGWQKDPVFQHQGSYSGQGLSPVIPETEAVSGDPLWL